MSERWKTLGVVAALLMLVTAGCAGFLFLTDDCKSLGGHIEATNGGTEPMCVVP